MGFQQIISNYAAETAGQTVCSTTDTTIMSTPSNRNFYVRTLQINNTDTSANRVRIYDGTVAAGTLWFEFDIAADDGITITDIKGFKFSSDLHGISLTSTGVHVAVGGEMY